MQINLKNLPTEASSLKQIIIDLVSEIQSLKHQLSVLKSKRFGRHSEKNNVELDKQIEDLELKIKTSDIGFDKNIIEEPKSIAKRQKLPDHLPRMEIILNPDKECPKCGNNDFRKIGEDTSETLEYVPSSFKVMRHIRPRCVCSNCDTIVQAYAPSNPIDKGKAGASLLAHVIVQKNCNHLPLYRQSEIYAREGIILPRSTLAGWMSSSADLLKILAIEIQKTVFSASQIHGDDTPVKVQAPGTGKTKTGRMWVYAKDGRPHGDNNSLAVCYFYSPDRRGIRPEEHLKTFEGVLHADSYAGYNGLYPSKENPDSKITESACMAHTRRKFYEVTVSSPKAHIASEVIEQIGKIYYIERQINGMPPDKRKEIRQEKSKILMDNLFAYLKKSYKLLSKKSVAALAIKYALNNEKALMRFLDDGKIEIDNNAAERAMRPIAVGRKNWLFAGSDAGGESAAILYTITETAKLNNINPWKYLSKVLSVIQDYNSHKIADLLPWNLKL